MNILNLIFNLIVVGSFAYICSKKFKEKEYEEAILWGLTSITSSIIYIGYDICMAIGYLK